MLYSCLICHNLASAIRLTDHSPPIVHRITSSIYGVLCLLSKHFPSISHSVAAITSPSLLLFLCPQLANFRFFSWTSIPFSSDTTIFCRTQTFVLYSGELICNVRLKDHNSNTMICLSLHFFTAKLSDPYNAMFHTNDLTI